jgi:hypothetical protein
MSTAPIASEARTLPTVSSPVAVVISPTEAEKSATVLARLDDQIKYHEGKSSKCQKKYKRIKSTEIIAAALIPFLAALHVADNHPTIRVSLAVLTALMGVIITILEGILQLNQYQQLWITSRSACEALNHEKYLYLARAGDYASAKDPVVLLAERVEAIGSQENTKWASLLQSQKESKGGS